MLNDDEVNSLVDTLVNRQKAINEYILRKLANRIKAIGELNPSDLTQLNTLYENGADIKDINKRLAELSRLDVADIKDIIYNTAMNSYDVNKALYDYRNKTFIPFKENEQLQKIVKAVERQTLGTYRNIAKAQAYMVRDAEGVLKPTRIAKMYQETIDKAIQAAKSGLSYHTVIRKTITDLVESGLRYVEYNPESGRLYTQSVDAAVKRNINDGIRAVNQGVQDITGEQFKADGKEITVHMNPAPDHAPIQGHQFTNEEFDKLQNGEPFKDILGNRFEGIDRAIGTLNCRHFTFSIIIGISKPNYTPEQLDDINKKNEKGYTDSKGNHYTMYECTQMQRDYERRIRKARECYNTLKQAGDKEGMEKYKAQVINLTNKYKQFSKACGLKPKFNKTI